MKRFRRWQGILILTLLIFSVFTPMVLVSFRSRTITSIGRGEFIQDLTSIRRRKDSFTLRAIEQETGEGLTEPKLLVFEDKNSTSYSSSDKNLDSDGFRNGGDSTNQQNKDGNIDDRVENKQPPQKESPSNSGNEKLSSVTKGQHHLNVPSQSDGERSKNVNEITNHQSNKNDVSHKLPSQLRRSTDAKISEIKDQLVRASAYVSFAPPGKDSHLVKELRARMKEMERALGEAKRDADLSRSALRKMRYMDSSLQKASRIFPDCPAMSTKLRAMNHNAEEQILTQRNQVSYLVQLASRTTPKGLHCLSMILTAEYFNLQPEKRQPRNQKKWLDPELYHYVLFSDNVLASAVVVNSTISTAVEPEKIVFHLVTNSLNLPAISMWFLISPPGKATVQILSVDNFEWSTVEYDMIRRRQNSNDPRFTSELNFLRFYLPTIFPSLNKIVLLDHDVVVQKDLSGLWSIDMKGKVMAAHETCGEQDVSLRRMDALVNFSDPSIASKFDANSCTWAFGMNLFDLNAWRTHKLTDVYHEFLQLGKERPVFRAGSLPLGWVTFYNQTVALDRKWHIHGLGSDPDVVEADVERAAVMHYDGVRKPWLDIAFARYKGYWSRYINYDHPYLQKCNIHG